MNDKARRSISTAVDDSFGVRAARLCNILPKNVNRTTSLDSRKFAIGAFNAQFFQKPLGELLEKMEYVLETDDYQTLQ